MGDGRAEEGPGETRVIGIDRLHGNVARRPYDDLSTMDGVAYRQTKILLVVRNSTPIELSPCSIGRGRYGSFADRPALPGVQREETG